MGSLRYHVKIDVRAAYDKMEIGLAELVRDHRQEMLRLIERLEGKSSKELEETISSRLYAFRRGREVVASGSPLAPRAGHGPKLRWV